MNNKITNSFNQHCMFQEENDVYLILVRNMFIMYKNTLILKVDINGKNGHNNPW